MIDFGKVYFGCADANTEAERNPAVFSEVFFDPHNYLNELINGDRFILRGRKGDGKTAYSAKIKLSADDQNIYAYQRSLNNFNNATFSNIKTYDHIGGNPYISFWKCILMIEFVGMINQYEPHIQSAQFLDLLEALRKNGFLSKENDISVTVDKLVESDSTINVSSVFSHNRKRAHETVLQGAEAIYNAVRNTIHDLYVSRKFIFIIDGLDDILNNSEFKSQIITGLIRAVEEINSYFRKSMLSAKIIVLVREDIINLCRDPNLSKILRDSGIKLSWAIEGSPYESDLVRLVEKRINEITQIPNSFEMVWKELFPQNIGTKESLDYVLENIIYRPRDILQFFIEAQKEFVPGKALTVDKVQNALARYSDDYFIDAMRDEMTGFFPDEAVTILPDILSKMGAQYFYLEDFEKECRYYAEFENVSIKAMLEKLFLAGYIGQHRPRDKGDYTVFSFRNPREKYVDSHECILHRGLMRALSI